MVPDLHPVYDCSTTKFSTVSAIVYCTLVYWCFNHKGWIICPVYTCSLKSHALLMNFFLTDYKTHGPLIFFLNKVIYINNMAASCCTHFSNFLQFPFSLVSDDFHQVIILFAPMQKGDINTPLDSCHMQWLDPMLQTKSNSSLKWMLSGTAALMWYIAGH